MKRILIVEDVELNRDLLAQLLEDEYEILCASDGASGLALAARERPDLILMDLSLPVLDGWEATRRLKADPELRGVPVIALSAHADVIWSWFIYRESQREKNALQHELNTLKAKLFDLQEEAKSVSNLPQPPTTPTNTNM